MRPRRFLRPPALAFAALSLPATSAGAAPQIQTHTLTNGLEVAVVESHGAPLVTVELAIKGGASVETPALSGVSHFHEHMMMHKNQVLPTAEAFRARSRALGLVTNASAGFDRVSFHATTVREHRAQAMAFMRDVFLSPRFDQEDLDRERGAILDELDRHQSDPMYVLMDRVDDRLWWKYPNRATSIGTRSSIRKTTVAKLRTIHERFYVPNNALLVVTGDVQAAAVFDEAQTLFAAWKRGPDPFGRSSLPKDPPLPATEVVVITQAVQNVKGRFGWQGPSATGAEGNHAGFLLPRLLNATWSRFQDKIVYSGPCMGVAFDWQPHRSSGPIVVQFSTTAEAARACIQAIQAELPRLKSPDYFSDEDLQLAVRRFQLDVALEREQPADLAHDLTFWWATAGLDYYRQRVARVSEVTRADIARLLDRYVIGKPFVLGVMLSPQTASKGLNRAYFEAALASPTVSLP